MNTPTLGEICQKEALLAFLQTTGSSNEETLANWDAWFRRFGRPLTNDEWKRVRGSGVLDAEALARLDEKYGPPQA